MGARRARQRTGDPLRLPSSSRRQILKIVWALQLCVFVASLSTAVVATALPTIVGDLGGQDQLAWVVTAQVLTMTVSTPLWGKVSDLCGRKPLMQAAIAVFTVSSALAGLAPSMAVLVAARAAQGVGGGGIWALSQAIVADVVEPRERGRYAGYFTAGGMSYGVATVAGPLIGGFLVEGPGWRWCFYVGVPIAVLASVVLQRTLRLPVVRRNTSVDWLGATLITASASALLLLLSLAGKEFAWASGWTAMLGAASLGCLLVAVVVERRAVEPILPPRLFRSRTFCLTGIAGFVAGFALFGAVIYLPQYLQVVRGKSPTVSGLLTMSLVVSMLLVSVVCGRSMTRRGHWRVFPLIGLGLVAAAAALLSTLRYDTSTAVVCGYTVIYGVGLGLTIQILVLAAQDTSERRDLGIATSCAQFFRSMGGAVGVGLFGAIFTSRLTSVSSHLGTPAEIAALPEPLRSAAREGFTLGLDASFFIVVPLALLGLLALLGVKESPLRGRTPAPAPVAEPPPSCGQSASTTGQVAGFD